MITLFPQSYTEMVASATANQELRLNEVGTNITATCWLASRSSCSVRLHCSVPMWSPSSDTCYSNGISASYKLAPSNSSLCFICALPTELSVPKVRSATVEMLQNARVNARQKVLLADLEHGPALIIS
ncbi:hypothetical protein F5141DRAFT_1075820 [Pisolithus sp. B1]|nr:hypothetical protein F5141DRAFT_1075820 [Pisolithus sp. B1]